jgi:serine/threonine-protein kinase PpkA
MQHPPTSIVSDKPITAIQVSGYVIERQIGRGGMATVYLALQESLQRHVALKVIASNLKGDPDFTKRFLREGQLIAKLTDPRIITVFDIGIDEDVYYLAMEYLPGGTLREHIQAGLSLEDTLQIVKTVAGALGYAHRRGVVHRDIKPQNIMFHENGDPVLSDFGIAKAIGGNTVMTMSGMYFGTPRYMSPEQIKGQAVDGRSDLYSLGVLFYEMLTGELPYSSDDSFALAFKHVTEAIPNLPLDLLIFQPLLNRLLAKDPEDRFSSAEQFLEALRELELQHLLTPTATHTTILPTSKFTQANTVPKRRPNYWFIAAFVALLPLSIIASIYFFAPPHWVVQSGKNVSPQEWASEKQPNLVQGELPDAAFFLKQARQFYDNGALNESLKTIAQGINAYPEDSDLLALRERVRDQLEQQLTEVNARNQEAERLLERAQRYRQQGNFEAALMDIEEGLKVVSQHPGLLDLRTQVLQQQQQTERQQSQQQRQQQADRLLSQAQQSKGNNDLSASENYITEGLRLAPDHAGLLALQAEIEQEKTVANNKKQRQAAAEERLEQVQPLLEQARQFQQQNQFQDSLDKIEQGLEIVPDHRELLTLQDEVKTQLEQQSQVINLLQECAAHFKANRLTTGEGGNALDCYNKVLDLDPGNTTALAGLHNMAERYANWAEQSLQNGTPQETSAYLNRLIQVNPEFPRLNQLQRRLAALQAENLTGPLIPPFDNPQEGLSIPQLPIIDETEAEAFWNAIEDSQDIADFDQFLALFGDHPRYGLAARLKRERLRREQVETTASEGAFLTVETNQPNAQVWIDGRDYGSTGQQIALPPGTYTISVEKEGYQEWREQIELVTGSDENITAILNPLSPAETQASAQTSSDQETSTNQNEGSVPEFGCIEGDCTNGTGVYLFKNGDKFSGEWKNSQIFNQGTYFYKNGEKYVGEFENGKINGTGTYYYNSGNRYEGTWKDGVKSGTGTHYYATRGERYVGEFKNNEPHGQGTYYYEDGDRYEGQWQNGRKHGEGRYYSSNGQSYTGIWENNRKVRVISFEQSSGATYE